MSWYSSTRTWSKRDADLRADDRVGHRLGPPDEQVVEVEDALRLLLVGVGGEQAAQLVLVRRGTRERCRRSTSASGRLALTARE